MNPNTDGARARRSNKNIVNRLSSLRRCVHFSAPYRTQKYTCRRGIGPVGSVLRGFLLVLAQRLSLPPGTLSTRFSKRA